MLTFDLRDVADDITVTHIRTVPTSGGRRRHISTTTSPRGKAVMIETFARDGEKLGGTFTLFEREVPDLLAAMAEAAAAIGAEATAASVPHVNRYSTRGRAL